MWRSRQHRDHRERDRDSASQHARHPLQSGAAGEGGRHLGHHRQLGQNRHPGPERVGHPKAANIFLVIDVTQKNISSQQQTANATPDWTLRDSTGQSYDQALASKGPDGDVDSNAQVRGQFYFEVPKAEKTFTLAFSPGLGDHQVIWDLAF